MGSTFSEKTQELSNDTAKTQDCVLLKRAVYDRDGKALAALQAKYGPRIRRYVASEMNSGTDAEDIVQDIFVELRQSHGHYNGHRDVEKYLFGMARHLISRYCRARRSQPKLIRIGSIDEVAESLHIGQDRDLAEQTSLRQLKKILEDAAQQLPPKTYEAVKLRFIEGLSSKEAAQKAGCSVKAFYARLERATRALQRIRSRMQKREIP